MGSSRSARQVEVLYLSGERIARGKRGPCERNMAWLSPRSVFFQPRCLTNRAARRERIDPACPEACGALGPRSAIEPAWIGVPSARTHRTPEIPGDKRRAMIWGPHARCDPPRLRRHRLPDADAHRAQRSGRQPLEERRRPGEGRQGQAAVLRRRLLRRAHADPQRGRTVRAGVRAVRSAS